MRVETLRELPAVLTRPDGTIREDYTIAVGEIAEAGYMGNAPRPDDLYILIVEGKVGRARASGVPPDAFFVPGDGKDDYRENPDEMVPCLVCQEPHRQGNGCDCLAPTAFYTLVVEIQAKTPGDLPGRQSLADGIFEGLPKEWHDIEIDCYRLVGIQAKGPPRTYNCPE